MTEKQTALDDSLGTLVLSPQRLGDILLGSHLMKSFKNCQFLTSDVSETAQDNDIASMSFV